MSAERDGPVIEIERARRDALAVERAQPREDALDVGDDVLARQHDDVVVGQEVERRRIVGARDERERPGLGDPGEAPSRPR